MAENDNDSSIFAIDLNSSSSDEKSSPSPKLPRDHQSEAQFQAVRTSWVPKTETGDLWKTLELPVDNPPKPESQKIIHAIEELYFFKRYEEALKVTETALVGVLQDEFKKLLLGYAARCRGKIEDGNG